MMGTWFLATAAGNWLASKIAQATGGEGAGVDRVLEVYSTIGWAVIVVGVIAVPISWLITRLMHLDELKRDDLAGQAQLAEPAAPGMHPTRETRPDADPSRA
jgi:POT family proton-dependent oligopeptide transporter